MIVKHIKCLF